MCICGWVFQSLGTNFATTKTKFVVIPQKPSLASCNPVSRSVGSQMQSKIYIGISDSFFFFSWTSASSWRYYCSVSFLKMVISSLGLFSAVVDDPPKHYPLTRQRHKAPSAPFVVGCAWGSIRTPLSINMMLLGFRCFGKESSPLSDIVGAHRQLGKGSRGQSKSLLVLLCWVLLSAVSPNRRCKKPDVCCDACQGYFG